MSLETDMMDSNSRFVKKFAKPILDTGYVLTGAVSTCAQYEPDGDESYCHVALISPGTLKRKDETLFAIIREAILSKEFEERKVFVRYIEFNPIEKINPINL